MSFNDPVSDLLTRIRNGLRNQSTTVNCVNSRVCRGVCDVLRDEGYIQSYDVIDNGLGGLIRVHLKYGPRGETILHNIRRESKPGKRVYTGVDNLKRPLDGLGISIVSTSRGVLSDRKCREFKVGGELLATVD
ncbi:MAG: 30S ribosomal protein S8 [Phycisphaerales bacterium]|nr:30S ribosomal protein S8 [Phycisphaerales bacterium]